MAINTDVQTFTPAEMLALIDYSIAVQLTGGAAYTLSGGKNFIRAPLAVLWKMKQEMQDQIAVVADESGGGIAIVEYGERGGFANRRDCLD